MPHSGALPPSRSGGNRSKGPASGGIPSVSHHKVRTLYRLRADTVYPQNAERATFSFRIS
eukprot:4285114-Prymnesium_polylepis.1